MATTKAAAKKAPAARKVAAPAKAASGKVKAADVAEKVYKVIAAKAGEKGLTIAELAELTGLKARVLQNVVWHLEGRPGTKSPGTPKVRNVGESRTRRFAPVK